MTLPAPGPSAPGRAAAPAPASRRLWPWIVGGLALLIVTALTVIAVADWGARTLEMRALVRDIAASESAMAASNDEITALVEELGVATSAEQQQEILAKIGAAAGVRAGILQEAGDRVANLRIAPWHRAVADARTAYLAHNRAWQEYLRAGAADPRALFGEWPDIETTWEALKRPLRRAVPVPDVYELSGRLDELLRSGDPPPEESDGRGAGEPAGFGAVRAALVRAG